MSTPVSSPGSSVTTESGGGPILAVEGLDIGFPGAGDVLCGVDLAIAPGEFVSVLGPSGCGKSTILNLAAGLLQPTRGTALFDGKPISKVNTAVGYMTQDDTLLPWRSVRANIGMPLKLRKRPRAEIKERVDRYLQLMDLTHAADLFPAQLSGGMRRRALLARSMIYDPRLLLMDEPFAALDAQMRTQMHIELRSAVKRLDQTVLFVTHDISEAAVLSDRVVVVGGGPPAGIVSSYDIPFPKDRDVANLHFEDRFAEVERELHTILSTAQTRRSETGEGEARR